MSESTIILWWGADLRVLTGDGEISRLKLGGAGDPVLDILAFVGRPGPAARTIRIVYHPDTLEAHEVPCPQTSRARLRKILAREHRALESPEAIWSVEAVRPGRQGYATILYLDSGVRLPRLADGLAIAGWRVEGAWPLLSLVETTPPCAAAGSGFLALVALDARALVACVGPAGDRSVRFLDGPEFAEAATAEAGAKLARFEDGAPPPGLIVADQSPHIDPCAAALGRRGLTAMPLPAFLAQARRLPSGGFSDFIARRPAFAFAPSPPRLMAFAGSMLLLVSLGVSWSAQQEQADTRRQVAAWREQHARLEAWLADRSALARRGDQAAQALSRAEAATPAISAFLEALGRMTPPEITLQSVVIGEGSFTLTGRDYDSTGHSDALARFWRDLANPGAPWRLAGAPPRTNGTHFILQGSFQTPVESSAP